MERTRSTTLALVGVAVTALSGCVAVEPRPAPAPRPETISGARIPGAATEGAPRQGRAREALEAMSPAPSAPRAASPVPASTGATSGTGGTGGTGAGVRGATEPAAAAPRHGRLPAGSPADRLPSAPPTVRTAADVCDLGESFGRWPKDSAQVRICRDVYGH